MKTKKKAKSGKTKPSKAPKTGKKAKLSKKERIAARAAKKKARKGDGSFPDIMVLTQETDKNGESYFAAHDGTTMNTIYTDETTVAVYKLRRVSTISIKRKIVR